MVIDPVDALPPVTPFTCQMTGIFAVKTAEFPVAKVALDGVIDSFVALMFSVTGWLVTSPGPGK